MIFWSILLVVFFLSWWLTLLLRRYALARSMMDVPNERSSHSVPTPRGGGVAIVAAFTLALPVLASIGLMDQAAMIGILGGGGLVAVIGFADDHGHIAARWRLLGHFVGAGWVLFWIKGLAPVPLFGELVDLRWLGDLLALIYLVWMLNLYNFMDGIDGLASAEAISVGVAACLVYAGCGHSDLMWSVLVLAAAVAGFLCWNFPPARIFMGDAGSGFLGVVLGAVALQAAWEKPELLWSWLILLGVFIVDATWTLLRRLLRGDKVYQAHRSHAYQHATRRTSSHLVVTSTVVLINVVWLLPWALLVGIGLIPGVLGCLIAYVPLAFIAWKFKAGIAA